MPQLSLPVLAIAGTSLYRRSRSGLSKEISGRRSSVSSCSNSSANFPQILFPMKQTDKYEKKTRNLRIYFSSLLLVKEYMIRKMYVRIIIFNVLLMFFALSRVRMRSLKPFRPISIPKSSTLFNLNSDLFQSVLSKISI